MKVKAAPGVKVPMDGAPRKYITDAQEVDVDETPYYLLRLKDGDLVRADSAVDTAATQTNATNATSTTSASSTPAATSTTKALASPASGVVTES